MYPRHTLNTIIYPETDVERFRRILHLFRTFCSLGDDVTTEMPKESESLKGSDNLAVSEAGASRSQRPRKNLLDAEKLKS